MEYIVRNGFNTASAIAETGRTRQVTMVIAASTADAVTFARRVTGSFNTPITIRVRSATMSWAPDGGPCTARALRNPTLP